MNFVCQCQTVLNQVVASGGGVGTVSRKKKNICKTIGATTKNNNMQNHISKVQCVELSTIYWQKLNILLIHLFAKCINSGSY